MKIISIENNGDGESYFGEQEVELTGTSARMLSDQIPALNFRLRTSDTSYSTDWHVAGDPTLLVILSGIIRIELRSGQVKDFSDGEMFIAKDYLPKTTPFNKQLHGHRAMVMGDKVISALHLKLAQRST